MHAELPPAHSPARERGLIRKTRSSPRAREHSPPTFSCPAIQAAVYSRFSATQAGDTALATCFGVHQVWAALMSMCSQCSALVCTERPCAWILTGAPRCGRRELRKPPSPGRKTTDSGPWPISCRTTLTSVRGGSHRFQALSKALWTCACTMGASACAQAKVIALRAMPPMEVACSMISWTLLPGKIRGPFSKEETPLAEGTTHVLSSAMTCTCLACIGAAQH